MAKRKSVQRVKLREKRASDNRLSLYLDWHDGHGKRKREFLKLIIFENPKGVFERTHNSETLLKAEILRSERERQLFSGDIEEVIELKENRNTDFLEYFQEYIDQYAQKDIRMMKSVLYRLKDFAPKHLPAKNVTEAFCLKFKEHLHEVLNGESPQSYFARFKKVLRYATKHGKLFKVSPAEDIINKSTSTSTDKDILTIDELKALFVAKCGNEEVKRAFLFSCYTGLRFSDVKQLSWTHIKNDSIVLKQSKTKEKSADGGRVVIHINETAKLLLDQQREEVVTSGNRVFNLPSHNAVLSNLSYWTKRAGIDKHITFHCARHTYGSLLAYYDNDIVVISELMGHTSTKHTQKYVRIAKEMKRKASESIPGLS